MTALTDRLAAIGRECAEIDAVAHETYTDDYGTEKVAKAYVDDALSALVTIAEQQAAEANEWMECAGRNAELLERYKAERDRLREVLLSRHGGEPLALLDELTQARHQEEEANIRADAWLSRVKTLEAENNALLRPGNYAELKAENERLKGELMCPDDGAHDPEQTWEDRALEMEAEIAALKDRRCETCARAYDDCIHHIQTVNGLADVDYCSEWERRAMLEAPHA